MKNILEELKEKVSPLLTVALTCCALTLLPVTGFSQGVPPSGSFTPTIVAMPQVVSWPSGATNLALGWASVVAYTNTSGPFYTNGASTLFTNIVYTTNTYYANMSIISQKDCGLIITESAGIGTNTFTFCRLLDSGTVDTNNTGTLTLNHPAASTVTSSTNFPSTWIGGFAGIQISLMNWVPQTSGTLTNPVPKYGKIVSVK